MCTRVFFLLLFECVCIPFGFGLRASCEKSKWENSNFVFCFSFVRFFFFFVNKLITWNVLFFGQNGAVFGINKSIGSNCFEVWKLKWTCIMVKFLLYLLQLIIKFDCISFQWIYLVAFIIIYIKQVQIDFATIPCILFLIFLKKKKSIKNVL